MNIQETTVQIVKPTKIIVYDFETTGLLDKADVQPIELAAYVIDVDGSKKIIHQYIKCPYSIEDLYINPKQTISTLTGITDEMCNNGYELDYVIKGFEDILRESQATLHCIVGHNILNYDNILYGMMQNRLGGEHMIDESRCFDTGGQFKGELLGWKKFDNLKHHQYQRRCLDAKSRVKWNLTAAGQHYGIASSGIAHSAIGDIENNLQVFIKQLKKTGKLPENLIQHEL